MANISLTDYYTGVSNAKTGSNCSLRNATINGYNEGDGNFTFPRDNLVNITQNNCAMSTMWAGTSPKYYTYPTGSKAYFKFKVDPCNASSPSTPSLMGVYDTFDDPSPTFPGLNGVGSSLELEGVTASPSYTQITGPLGGAQAGLIFNGSTQRCRFPSVSLNYSYIADATKRASWVAWVYFGELQPSSIKNIWANSQDTTGLGLSYYGVQLKQANFRDGVIVMLQGDGTGAASSDRRSYSSVVNAVSTGWHLVFFQIAGITTTFNTPTTNRILVSSAASGVPDITDKIFNRTGTGGNLTYNTSYRYCLGQFSSGGYFNGAIGHQWYFVDHISEDEYSSLYEATYQLYQ